MDFPAPVFVQQAGSPQVQLDPQAIDDVVRAHGPLLVHWRAMSCPVGKVDRGDSRRPHPDHAGCSYGFLFTLAGKFRGILTGNTKQYRGEGGKLFLDASQARLSLPLRYEDGTCPEGGDADVMAQPFDRFYLDEADVVVARYDTVQATLQGVDKLPFPAVRVQDLVDERGVRYAQDVDFVLQAGAVRWLPGRGPVSPGNGSMYAIRYVFRPFYFVDEMSHELRLGKDPATGATIRLGQEVVVRREYALTGTGSNEAGAEAGRGPLAPASGGQGAAP